MNITDRLLRRFWEKVYKTPKCWLWVGGGGDYGTFNGGNENNQATFLAHRISYVIHYGRDPVELLVCHTCNNPRCVKPDHLFLGTGSDNQQHASLTGVHSQLKISNEDVVQIRFLAALGISQKEIGRRFKITASQVSHIVNGQQRTQV